MKTSLLISSLLFFITINVFGQDISRREVPSIILNNFQNTFPKAKDIEWEKKGDHYKVEFEIGFWNDDQTTWYSSEGQLLRHQEEISKKELPDLIRSTIDKDYRWYLITDVARITKEQSTHYQVELKSFTKEWKLLFDESGKILYQKPD